MATYVRPGDRKTTSDWYTTNYALSTNAERERNASHATRQEARFLQNECANRAKWDQLDTNCRLADRVGHLRRLKDVLEEQLANLDKEISQLSAAKDQMDHSMEDKNLDNHINIENLVLREARMETDVVEDEVEEQLLKVRCRCLLLQTLRFH